MDACHWFSFTLLALAAAVAKVYRFKGYALVKPLPILWLLLCSVQTGIDHTAPVVAILLVSTVGDLILVCNSIACFWLGLWCFLAVHLLYVVSLMRWWVLLPPWGWTIASICCSWGAFRLYHISASRDRQREVLIPCYGLALVGLLVAAWFRSMGAVGGAVSFILSDVLIALGQFRLLPPSWIQRNESVTLLLYYFGQAVLVSALVS